MMFSLKKLENEYLQIYDGGSKYSDFIANITADTHNQTEISSTRNQMFVTLKTSTKDAKMGGFRASIEKLGTFFIFPCIRYIVCLLGQNHLLTNFIRN